MPFFVIAAQHFSKQFGLHLHVIAVVFRAGLHVDGMGAGFPPEREPYRQFFALADGFTEIQAHESREFVGWPRSCFFQGFCPLAAVFLGQVFQRFQQQFLLAFEMQVDDAQAQARLAGDVRHGRSRETAFGDAIYGRLDELFPAPLFCQCPVVFSLHYFIVSRYQSMKLRVKSSIAV